MKMKTTMQTIAITAVAVTIWTGLIAQAVMPEPVQVAKAENAFCPPDFHEYAEYGEDGEWIVFACERIETGAFDFLLK